jgi:hypothetical protein
MIRCLVAVVAMVLFVVPAEGQHGLRRDVARLFEFGDCGEPLCLNVDNNHGHHYIAASTEQSGQILAFLSNAIGTSIASIPVGGSSGGTTFTFEGGLPVRSTVSAGPIYAERAETIGRGRFLAGANATLFHFTSIRSTPLDRLEFVFTHQNVGDPLYGDPIFENDVIRVDMDLSVQVTVSSIFLAYGLTDRLDLGVALPFVNTAVSGVSNAQIQSFGVTPHTFGGPDEISARAAWSGSARGIGDIVFRGKANLGESAFGSVAILGDVRVPTGDEDNLLGTGSANVRVLGILSGRFGDFSPHLNGGVLVRTGEFERNAALASVGFDHLINPSVTLAIDFLSSWEYGDVALALPAPRTFDVPYQRTVRLSNIRGGSDDSAYLSLGTKISALDNLTIVANTLTPIIRGGFQPAIAGTLGIEFNP